MSAAGPAAPPHAPEIGRLARWAGAASITGVFWYRFHAWGAAVLPEFLVRPVVRLFTTFFFVVLNRIRRALGENLEAALGDCGWLTRQRRAYRSMHTFAWCLHERYERLTKDVALSITEENGEAWRRAVEGGRGVLLVTAHVGNWEVGSGLPASLEQRRVHLVRERESDPRAQALIESMLRERMGPDYTTHFATGDPRLGVELLEALRRGDVVALQGDRPRAGGHVVQTRMFGRPYALPRGPFALARVAETPLLPVFTLRTGRLRYRVVFRDPILVARSSDRNGDFAAAAETLAQDLEWAIREEPHQWFCFRKVWG